MYDESKTPSVSVAGENANPLTLSVEALNIIQKQPRGWEWRLFARVIADECRQLAAIPRRCFVSQSNDASRLDVIASSVWLRERHEEIQPIFLEAASVVEGDNTEAFGPPGIPGDATKLVALARRLIACYRKALEWTCNVELTAIDFSHEDAAYEEAVIGRGVVVGIERFANEILAFWASIDSGPANHKMEASTITLQIGFKISYRFEESMKNVQTMLKTVGEAMSQYASGELLEEESTEGGHLYLAVNPSMEGLVKIGKTTRSPKERTQSLSAATGVPTPFILVFDVVVNDCLAAEEYVHQELENRGYRVSQRREFFRVPTAEAIKLMLEAERQF